MSAPECESARPGQGGDVTVVPCARRREPQRRGGGAGRYLWPAALVLAAVVLFVAYLRLSNTYPEDSDQANLGLQAWDMLHGNLLLHGWVVSDVSFYTTELPQYMLLELILGLNTGMFHAAAAMTYTLVLLLAALLAKGRATGREGVARVLVTGGIMLAPQLGFGVFILLLTVGHIGTSVPLLLTWLILDRCRPRWPAAVMAGIVLTWGAMADSLVLAVGALPLGVVCAVRVIQGLSGPDGGLAARVRHAVRSRWYELSLGAAAVASAGLSVAAVRLIHVLGGYSEHAVTFRIEPPGQWASDLKATWHGILVLFGADYTVPGHARDLALLHLAGVALVAAALIVAAWRFRRVPLIDQVLAVAIVVNVALYLASNMPSLNPHELAVVLPFGAALAGRMLVRRRGGAQAAPVRGAARPAGVAVAWAGLLVLAGYAVGLGREAAEPPVPAANARLSSWLAAHHLTHGLGGYWESGIVTVDSHTHVTVRALMQYTLQADLWESKAAWYDPRTQSANFVVFDSTPGFYNHWEPRALVQKYFGRPAHTYSFGPYTVMVWAKNLLASVPAG
jgi:hypothetical protein